MAEDRAYEAGKWAFLAGQAMGRAARLRADIEAIMTSSDLGTFQMIGEIRLLLRQNEQGIQEDFERSQHFD